MEYPRLGELSLLWAGIVAMMDQRLAFVGGNGPGNGSISLRKTLMPWVSRPISPSAVLGLGKTVAPKRCADFQSSLVRELVCFSRHGRR